MTSTLGRIKEALARSFQGDRDGARHSLQSIWHELEDGREPFSRCVLAHYMADLQKTPSEELMWDLRALDAVGDMTEATIQAIEPTMSLPAMLPSLYLNAADSHRKVGNMDEARRHIAIAAQHLGALPSDGYGKMIRSGIKRLQRALQH